MFYPTEIEMQLGEIKGKAVYAECPYECGSNMLGWRWWDDIRAHNSDWPIIPTEGVTYTIY